MAERLKPLQIIGYSFLYAYLGLGAGYIIWMTWKLVREWLHDTWIWRKDESEK